MMDKQADEAGQANSQGMSCANDTGTFENTMSGTVREKELSPETGTERNKTSCEGITQSGNNTSERKNVTADDDNEQKLENKGGENSQPSESRAVTTEQLDVKEEVPDSLGEAAGTTSGTTDAQDSKSEDTSEGTKEDEEYLDILGNGTLLKKIVETGTGPRALMGERVTLQFQQEIPELNKTFPGEEKTFILGDGDVVQALDLVVALMNLGEKAIVIAGFKYMYGQLGLEPDIPPCANFKMNVHLVANDGTPDYNSMDFDTRFKEAKVKKERGNYLFKRKEYSLALNSYTKATKILDPMEGCVYPNEAPEKLQEMLEYRAIILCNTSVAQLRVDAYTVAVKSAQEATTLSPTYSKAYFRLGQAYEKLGQIDETIKSYKLALKYDPDNSKLLHSELARLTKLNKQAKQSQQEMYSKMFWGSKPPPVNQDKASPASWMSTLWKAGSGVMVAGLVGLAGIGVYRYMNH